MVLRTVLFIIIVSTTSSCPCRAESDAVQATPEATTKFYSFWSSLKPAMKEHYVSGYLQGWSDAESIHKLAVESITKDPTNPIATLETVAPMFDISDTSAKELVGAIDDYLKNQAAHASSVSKVISIVRAKQSGSNFKILSNDDSINTTTHQTP